MNNKIDLNQVQNSLLGSSNDELEATIDALTDILQSKSISGTNIPENIQLPPEIWQTIEPKLHKPKPQKNNNNNNNNSKIKIDDPDKLLKKDDQNNQDDQNNLNNHQNRPNQDTQNRANDSQDNSQDDLYDNSNIKHNSNNSFKDAEQQKAEADDLLNKKATLKRLNDLLNNSIDKAKQTGDSEKQQELSNIKSTLNTLMNLTDEELLKTSAATIDAVEDSILNATQDTEKIERQSASDMQKNIARLQALENDPFEKQALSIELNDNKFLDPVAQQMAQIERQRRQAAAASESAKTPQSFSDFKKDLVNTVEAYVDEIEQEERETLMNSDLADQEDYFKPVTQLYDLEKKEKPIVLAYLDTSGSWSSSDLQKAKDAVNQIAYYDDVEDLIELYIKYEGGNISDSIQGSMDRHWPSNWNGMMEDIKSYAGNVNVVLFLDDDVFEKGANRGGITATTWASKGGLTVNGHVWFIWKNKAAYNDALNYNKYTVDQAIHGPNAKYNKHYIFS